MVKIEAVNGTLDASADYGDAGPPTVILTVREGAAPSTTLDIHLTAPQAEALENALRILRREIERTDKR